jgi:hypothetical protein
MASGGFERHLRRMRTLYSARRSALLAGVVLMSTAAHHLHDNIRASLSSASPNSTKRRWRTASRASAA